MFWLAIRLIFVSGLVLTLSSAGFSQQLESALNGLPSQFASQAKPAIRLLEKYQDTAQVQKNQLIGNLKGEYEKVLTREGQIYAGPMLSQIQELQQWLNHGGDLPDHPPFLMWILQYAESLEVERSKLYKSINKLAKSLNRAGRHDLTMLLEKGFQSLGGVLNAANVVKVDAEFSGYRIRRDADAPRTIRFEIKAVQGNKFTGIVSRDLGYSNHPIHQFSGEFNGLTFAGQTGGPEVFGRKLDGRWRYSGYVLGNSIVGTFSGIGIQGKPGDGVFRVDL